MIELIVNNVNLDLSERTRIGLTVLSSDITNLTTRTGDFTNTFTIPATKKNMNALDHVNLMTSSSNLPYRIVRATFKQDGVEVASNAYCVINSVTNESITMNIFTGNLDFIKEIGELTVGELYENESSLTWNKTNVINGSDSLVFPIIKWNDASDVFLLTPNIDARELLPCLRFNDLLDKLSNRTKFSIGGTFDKEIIITPNNFAVDSVEYSLQNTNVFSGSTTNIPEGNSITNIVLTPVFNTPQSGEFSNNRFAPNTSRYGSLTFTSKANVTWKKLGNYGIFETPKQRNIYLVIKLKDNLGTVYKTIQTTTITTKLDVYNNPLILPLTFEIAIESPLMIFESGKTYYPEVTAYVSQHDNIQSQVFFELGKDVLQIQNKGCNVLTFKGNTSLVYGNELKVSNLFTMKVSDVIKEVINSYQVMIVTDNYIKSVKLNYLDTLLQNKNKSIDLSDNIIDLDSVSFVIPNLAKRNHLKYKAKDNSKNDSDSYFDVANENMQKESVYVQLQSEMTNTYKGYNNEDICTINGLNNAYEWQNPTWRILELEEKNTPYNVTYTDNGADQTNSENVPFAIFRNFDYLKENYFKFITSVSIDSKVINATMKINVLELQKIRSNFIPVWIYSSKYNIDGYYHVNKIENYQNNIAQLELIRL